MAFTQTQLDALETAIASGTLEVRYGDKIVHYQSMADLILARDLVRDNLGLSSSRTSFSSFARD